MATSAFQTPSKKP